MSTLIPVTPEKFEGKFWKKFGSYQFAASVQFAPLVLDEIYYAVRSLPLAVVDNKLVAVLSMEPGRNLFVSPRGKWAGGYVPAIFRGHPFSLVRAGGQENEMVLCVDESSGLISDTDGQPFFDDGKTLSRPTSEVLDFLTKVEQNRTLTQGLVNALIEADVLELWKLKGVDNIFRMDRAKLNRLDGETFLSVRKSLPIAYAQLFSMANIGMFEMLEKMRDKNSQAPEPDMNVLEDFDIDWEKIKI